LGRFLTSTAIDGVVQQEGVAEAPIEIRLQLRLSEPQVREKPFNDITRAGSYADTEAA
jgi:hypothetical protein